MPRGVEKTTSQWIDDIYNEVTKGPGDWVDTGSSADVALNSLVISTRLGNGSNSEIMFNVERKDKWVGGHVLRLTLHYALDTTSSNNLPITWEVTEVQDGDDLSAISATATNSENVTTATTANEHITYTFTNTVAVTDNCKLFAHRISRGSGDTNTAKFYLVGLRVDHYPDH